MATVMPTLTLSEAIIEAARGVERIEAKTMLAGTQDDDMQQYEYLLVASNEYGDVRAINGVPTEDPVPILEYLNRQGVEGWEVVSFSQLNLILKRPLVWEGRRPAYNYAHVAFGEDVHFSTTDPNSFDMIVKAVQQLELSCKVKVILPSMVVEFGKLNDDKRLLIKMIILSELTRQGWEPFSAFGSGDVHLRRQDD